MTVSNTLLDQIRQRARFACEYCGVTETDTGGVLYAGSLRAEVSVVTLHQPQAAITCPPSRGKDYALPPGSSER